MPKLIILESPNKIKKFEKVLGNGYIVAATVGHFREPAKAFDHNLGFQIIGDKIECAFSPTERGASIIKKLRALARQCDEVVIASDDDREGEAIGWHVLDVLKPQKYSRIVTNEITEKGILQAIARPRTLDFALVDAQKCRQFMDRSYGYMFSPLLIHATQGECRSVGRVQTAGLVIVAERYLERQRFQPQDYWSVSVTYEDFTASYAGMEGATDPAPEPASPNDIQAEGDEEERTAGKRVRTQAEADEIVAIAQAHPHTVRTLTRKQTQQKPPPPLTTSSMQQLAGNRLHLSADQCMQVAQTLFESGLITYHRTDSIALSADAKADIRQWLQHHHPDLVPQTATQHKQSGNAQAAHEAIRPTDPARTPQQSGLRGRELQLYTLIWQRAIASQCAAARFDKSKVTITAGPTLWEATGSIMQFDGFNRIYRAAGRDNELPTLQEGQALEPQSIDAIQKQTQPPGQFTEAKLVATLEKKGIGRPSTYATIMKTLFARGYIKPCGKKKIDVTETGMRVYEWIQTQCQILGDLKLTALMEQNLDEIASGQKNWEEHLSGYMAEVIMPTYWAIAQQTPRSPQQPFQQPMEVTEFHCLCCGQPLQRKRYRKKSGKGQGELLCCPESKTHPVFFQTARGYWNPDYGDARTEFDETLTLETLKQEQSARTRQRQGTPTEYVCQQCGKSLHEIPYQKDGQTKKRLACSANSKHPVYFFTSKGSFWNPNGVELSKKFVGKKRKRQVKKT